MPKESRMIMEDGENLPSICLEMHMQTTGASDTYNYNREMWDRHKSILTSARENWAEPSSAFDFAVWCLVRATQMEVEDYEASIGETSST